MLVQPKKKKIPRVKVSPKCLRPVTRSRNKAASLSSRGPVPPGTTRRRGKQITNTS